MFLLWTNVGRKHKHYLENTGNGQKAKIKAVIPTGKL